MIAWSTRGILILVAALAILLGGCRSGPEPIVLDPVPMAHFAGMGAVRVAVLSGEVDVAQLRMVQPYVQAAYLVAAAAPEDRPMVVAELLAAQVPGLENSDSALLMAGVVDFCTALQVEKASPDVERAAALTAAFLLGVDDAIRIISGGAAGGEPA